jgi:hypothetical protein
VSSRSRSSRSARNSASRESDAILLDECVDQRLRLLFVDHACETAGYAKLAGLKNGALLDAAEPARGSGSSGCPGTCCVPRW